MLVNKNLSANRAVIVPTKHMFMEFSLNCRRTISPRDLASSCTSGISGPPYKILLSVVILDLLNQIFRQRQSSAHTISGIVKSFIANRLLAI